jgi:hypothetical protein
MSLYLGRRWPRRRIILHALLEQPFRLLRHLRMELELEIPLIGDPELITSGQEVCY